MIRSLLITAGEFKREDLARTVLNYVVQDLSQITQLVSSCHGLKHVFFTGGFCSSPLIRSIITAEFARRNMTKYIQGQVKMLILLHDIHEYEAIE